MITCKEFLIQLTQKPSLSRQEAFQALAAFSSPDANTIQQAAFLALLAMRGETPDELSGFLAYLRENTIPVSLNTDHAVIDIVGTGGDHLQTFNISTAASLLVASAGVWVAKHGGRAASSQAGSADVLEALGVSIPQDPQTARRCLEQHHFAFLLAPQYNPILRYFSTLRRELGFRTFFNVLGPLANPASVKRQVIGVSHAKLIDPIIQTLKISGSTHALVVHSLEGMDEISLSSPTKIAELHQGVIKEYVLDPQAFGLATANLADFMGGDALQNAEILRNLFAGKETEAKRDIVLLNAAAGFLVAGRVRDFTEGIAFAKHVLEQGAPQRLLTQLQNHHD